MSPYPFTSGNNISFVFLFLIVTGTRSRHPFSLTLGNNDLNRAFRDVPKEVRRPIITSEHILLQSSLSIYNNSHINYGPTHTNRPNRHFMLDAGSSMFSSSMAFLACAYSQRKISFNEVFAWEVTLLEPKSFWADVSSIYLYADDILLVVWLYCVYVFLYLPPPPPHPPPLQVPTRWKPFYHYYNIPISAPINSTDSPLFFIEHATEVDDFVAFKLDVDTPSVELPILQYILEHPSIAEKIDEFFFELHFDCEVMMHLGWDRPQETTFMGKTFDRTFAFEVFTKLREMGIRAHVWP